MKRFPLNSLVLPLILLIITLTFYSTLNNDFIDNLDDNVYILQNELIKNLDWNFIKTIFTSFFQGNYHPLTLLTFAIEYKIYGLNPVGYHLSNLILHLLNTLLVFIFVNKLTGKQNVAAIVSIFFGIHPMHVESVAWISERKDVLYTFFFLLSLLCYTKYRANEKRKSNLLFTFIFFVFSLLSKPSAVCLPFVLLLIDFYKNHEITKFDCISKIPFFLLALLFGILTIHSQNSISDLSAIHKYYTISDRFFLISYSILFYIVKAVVPFQLSVMHFYPVKVNEMLPIVYYISFPVLLIIIWVVIRNRKLKHELQFGMLFYFITIALMLQILPAGQTIVSERYSYLPYIGLFFIVGQFYDYFRKKAVAEKILLPMISIIVILFSFFSIQRNKQWKNGEILTNDVVQKYPKYGYGWYLLGNIKNEKKDFIDAIQYYSKAIELAPAFPDAYLNRGIAEESLRNFDAAISDYTYVINLSPENGDVYLNRGNCENDKGDYNAAIRDYDRASELEINPSSAYYNLGIAEDERNNYDSAIACYTKAININPNYMLAYFNRGNSENKKKDFMSAIKDYTKAIELSPGYSAAFFNRGLIEYNLNNHKEACKDWEESLYYGNSQAAELIKQYCKQQ